MKIRKFHLKDFPEHRIRILFKCNEDFLDETITHFGSLKALAKFLNTSSNTIHQWKKLNLFIPLKHIKKIVVKRNLDWKKVEENVVAYKGPNSSLIVHKPKLPIVETPELFALIAHLIADGSVNKNGIPVYTNKNKRLIDNFQKLVSSVFGNIKSTTYLSDSGIYQLRTSMVISDLLSYFYDQEFSSIKAKVPQQLQDSPSEFAIAFIRAFVDDEGHVDSNHRINVYSQNKEVLESIHLLLTKKLNFKNVSPVLAKSKKDFYISIKSGDLKKYYTIIGFNHPLKMTTLNKLIKMRENSVGIRRKANQTKKEILNLLSSDNLSTEELTLILGIRRSNVRKPLNELRNDGLIISSHKKGQTIIWATMEE